MNQNSEFINVNARRQHKINRNKKICHGESKIVGKIRVKVYCNHCGFCKIKKERSEIGDINDQNLSPVQRVRLKAKIAKYRIDRGLF